MENFPSKPRILIAEDEAIIAMDLEHQINDLGYEAVGMVATGEAVIEMAGKLMPELVLMDIQLAGETDGISAAEILRARYDLPVIFVTGSANQETLARAKLVEPLAYIHKPFTVRELRTALDLGLYKHGVRQEERARTEQTALFQQTLLELRDHVTEDPEEFYDHVTRTLAQALRVERVGIWFYDENQAVLTCASSYSSTSKLIVDGGRLEGQFPNYFKALLTEPCIQADDVYTNAATMEMVEDYLKPLGITSMMDVPIMLGERRAGIICHEHIGPPRHWTIEENKFAVSAAGYVMLALERASRRKVEETLCESEERHRLMIRECRDAMMTLNPPHWRFTSCNPATVKLFELESEEHFCNLSPWQLSPEFQPDGKRSAEKALECIETAMQQGSYFFEWTHRRFGGASFPATVLLSRMEQNGQPFLQATVRDITIRKQAEQALRDSHATLELRVAERTAELQQSQERLNLALEATSDGVWDWNMVTNEVYLSPQWLKLMGHEAGDLPPGEILSKLMHPDDLENFNRALQEHIEGRAEVKLTESRVRSQSGEYRWMLDRAKIVSRDESGKPLRMIGTTADITQRKKEETDRERLQQQIFQNQKYEALGTLAGGVAHDFNNILTGVINYTTLAREDCPSSHPQVGEYLAEVLTCSARAKELVRQILLFSRSEDSERVPLQLAKVVQEAASLLRSTIPANVEIVLMLDQHAPLVVANPTQIHQIVMNLGINAVHALPETGGTLSIKLQVKGSELGNKGASGDMVCLVISDTGCGMTPAVLERIFEPFFTTKSVGTGTGLGLAMVRSIMVAHGGDIGVESTVGVGTTFTLSFPSISTAVHKVEVPKGAMPRGQGQHILMVDDEIMVARPLQMMLERLGYRVSIYTHPVEAWQQFQVTPDAFDCMLSDFQMPGMTGSQLAGNILSLRPNFPIYIASGYTENDTAENMTRMGVRGIIHKPTELAELAAILGRDFALP